MELLVALGLMAILMSMIFTIFFQATQSFRVARAAVEAHQNVRAAYDVMLRDFSAAEMCPYEEKQGYFALSRHPDRAYGDPDLRRVPAVTFTTLAEQAGAQPLVPGVTPQVALVRFTLERDGDAYREADGQARPTYNLVKKVRFPQLAYPFVDMNEFDPDWLQDERVVSEVLAMRVLDMKVRFYYAPNMTHPSGAEHGVYLLNVLDFGHASGLPGGRLDDDARPDSYTAGQFTGAWQGGSLIDRTTRFLSWQAARQRFVLGNNDTNSLVNGAIPPLGLNAHLPAYRVEDLYCAGTVSVQTGNNMIQGTGTTWTRTDPDGRPLVAAGSLFVGPDGRAYQITSINSDISITLANAYVDANVSGAAYTILPPPMRTPTWVDLPDDSPFAMRVIERLPTGEMPEELNTTADAKALSIHMPALVEITLELTDRRNTRIHTFTERFHIPASER